MFTRKEVQARYRAKHKEAISEKNRERYRKLHPAVGNDKKINVDPAGQRKRDIVARYRARNKERIAERWKEIYYLKKSGKYIPRKKQSPEEKRRRSAARVRRWKQAHPEKVAAYIKREKENSPDAAPKRMQKWKERHPENWRTRKLLRQAVPGSHTREQWVALCAKFRNRCVCCGVSGKKLTRDHVIPVTHQGTSDYIQNIQPLCLACNVSKSNRAPLDYRKTPFTGIGQAVMFC